MSTALEKRRELLAHHGYGSSPEQILQRLAEGFEVAEKTHCLDALIGPLHTRFTVAGSSVAEALLAPFRHLVVAKTSAAPALTVDLWSSSALPGLPISPAPWGLVVDDQERRLFHDWRPEMDMVLDQQERRILGRFDDPALWRADQWARPLHRLLGGVLSLAGSAMLHAALVGESGSAVLLAGPGGSGKSTTALACLFAGLDILGDDTVAAAINNEGVIGYSIFSTALADPGYLAQRGFPCYRFSPQVIANETKQLWRLGSAPRQSRITAILLPSVGGGGRTIAERTRGGDFLRATAAHSTFVNIQDRRLALEIMSQMAERLPVWRLSLGEDPAEIAETVRGVIHAPNSGRC